MSKVQFTKGKFSGEDENICGQCARKGDCPLKRVLQKAGVIDDPGSRTLFCGLFRDEKSGTNRNH